MLLLLNRQLVDLLDFLLQQQYFLPAIFVLALVSFCPVQLLRKFFLQLRNPCIHLDFLQAQFFVLVAQHLIVFVECVEFAEYIGYLVVELDDVLLHLLFSFGTFRLTDIGLFLVFCP